MGNPPFEDVSPIKNGGFPASYISLYHFSVAIFELWGYVLLGGNQVHPLKKLLLPLQKCCFEDSLTNPLKGMCFFFRGLC